MLPIFVWCCGIIPGSYLKHEIYIHVVKLNLNCIHWVKVLLTETTCLCALWDSH